MSSAGQAVGGVIGAVVGFFVGGPAGAVQGAMWGAGIGAAIDPPRGPTTYGPRLADLSVQTSTYGQPIPRVYGTVALTGNVIWVEGGRIKETVRKKKVGGKGGSTATQKTYHYSATFAVALGERPNGPAIVGIKRVWLGMQRKPFYDAGATDPETVVASREAGTKFRWYPGSDTQQPDPRIVAEMGVGSTPAWRGLAYLVFDDLDLGEYQNSLAGVQVLCEVYTAAGADAPISTPVAASLMPGTGVLGRGHLAGDEVRGTGVSVNFTVGAPATAHRWAVPASCASGIAARSSSELPWKYQYAFAPYPAVIPGVEQDYIAVYAEAGTPGDRFCDDNGFVRARVDGLTWPGGLRDIAVARAGSVFVLHAWDVAPERPTEYVRFRVSGDGQTLTVPDLRLPSASAQALFHRLFLDSSGAMYGWNRVDGALYEIDDDFAIVGGPWRITLSSPNNIFLDRDGDRFYFLRAGPEEWVWDGQSADLTLQTVGYGGPIGSAPSGFVVGERVLLCISDLTYSASAGLSVFGEAKSSVPVSLASVVQAECVATGVLTAGDVNVSGLTDQVVGMRVASASTARQVLENLRAAFPFDVVQNGYALRFIRRGATAALAIAEADLGAHSDDGTTDEKLVQIVESAEALPRRVNVRYLDRDRQYDVNAQYADRVGCYGGENAVTIDLPIVLDANAAARAADTLISTYWSERVSVSFTVPAAGTNVSQILVGGVVSVPVEGGTMLVRVTKVDRQTDSTVAVEGRQYQSGIYASAAVGVAGSSGSAFTLSTRGGTTYHLLDVPCMGLSALDTPSYLIAAAGGAAWPGGVILESRDGGSEWDAITEVGPPGSTLGVALNMIGAPADTRQIDAGSALQVRMNGDLSSVTTSGLYAGRNRFAYGADRRWEIIGARTVIAGGNGLFALTDMLRGQFGTEWACGLHQVGDALIWLDVDNVAIRSTELARRNVLALFRGITFGADMTSDRSRQWAWAGVNLKPRAPINLLGSLDPLSGDWSFSWTPRSRFGNALRDGANIEADEAQEIYQVRIFSGGFVSLKREIVATSPSAVYTAAQQTADFGSPQTTVYVSVAKVSARVGAGYATQRTISV